MTLRAVVLALPLLMSVSGAGCLFDVDVATAVEKPASLPAASDAGSEADAEPVMHDACGVAMPADLPQEPKVQVDSSGRPLFDLYQDIDCEDASGLRLCGLDMPCADTETYCLQDDPGALGVCVRSMDFTRPAFSFQKGGCLAFASMVTHKRACCSEVPGVDCRAWPYRATSSVGELCARHDDCQRGLLCNPLQDMSPAVAGVCSCPGPKVDPAWCEDLYGPFR